MQLIDQRLADYALRHTSAEDPILKELYRDTQINVPYPHMISGHLQGKLIEMIAHMIKPERILEIGTFTGYSAICLARGLAATGILHTIELNDELAELAQRYFAKAGLQNRIILHTGDAMEIIPRLKELFELVFIDGSKAQYPQYYKLVFPVVKEGGYILADNVLWDGKVLQEGGRKSKETRGISEFNQLVMSDERVEKILLPVRDGLMLIRKKQAEQPLNICSG